MEEKQGRGQRGSFCYTAVQVPMHASPKPDFQQIFDHGRGAFGLKVC